MADVVALIAFGCAVFLLLGIAGPIEFTRTSWEAGTANRGTIITDSPAGYSGLVSLGGLVALVALAAGLWRRWPVAAAVAAVAFAVAAYVAAADWVGLSHGVALLEGNPDSNMRPPRWIVHWPPALPFFCAAAVVGVVGALLLVNAWGKRFEKR